MPLSLATAREGGVSRVKCMKPSFPQKLPLLVWASTRLTTCKGSSDEAPWLGSKRPPGRVATV